MEVLACRLMIDQGEHINNITYELAEVFGHSSTNNPPQKSVIISQMPPSSCTTRKKVVTLHNYRMKFRKHEV